MKGITPVIAMILLVLIVVALGGVFAAWTSRITTTTTEAGEEQIEQVTQQLQKTISIDSVDCTGGFVYIRNLANAPLAGNEIGIYVNGVAATPTCLPDPIPGGQVGSCDTSLGALTGEVRVVVSGNSARYTCP